MRDTRDAILRSGDLLVTQFGLRQVEVFDVDGRFIGWRQPEFREGQRILSGSLDSLTRFELVGTIGEVDRDG